jgi:hypothetical protein
VDHQTPPPHSIQYATPPTHDSNLDTDGDGPHRYRKLEDLQDPVPIQFEEEEAESCLLAAEEPSSVDDALESEHWREAMREELRSIVDNNTW